MVAVSLLTTRMMRLEGFGVQRKAHEEAPCGCWSQSEFSEDDELLELHVQICEDHMAMAAQAIELRLLSAKEQLTLPLPSRDGRPEY